MIYKYEMACKEAGLSEEATAEIRKFFDAEQKKLKRRKEAKNKSQLCFISVEELAERAHAEDITSYDIPDLDTDTAMMAIENMELDILRECMGEWPEEDKEFLLACYEGERGVVMELAKKYGISQSTASYRKKNLFEKLKNEFLNRYHNS